MEKEELLKHYRHSLEVYQDRLADSEEDKFYTKVHGYRNASYEQGLEYSQEIEITNGAITRNIKSKYVDYKWDVPFSKLGG